MINFNNVKHIHFIGISGISMRGLAKYTNEKYSHITITGNTDIQDFYINSQIIINPNLDNIINHIHICIYTASISDSHAELMKIKDFNHMHNNKIILLTRVEYLNLITSNNERICILGAHGKTSITTYTSELLDVLKPTTFVGAIINQEGDTYKTYENSNLYIVENDESQPSFTQLTSEYTIIPNISNDHLENYSNSFQEYLNTFKKYLTLVQSKNKYIIYNKNVHYHINNNFNNLLNNMILNSNLEYISYGVKDCDVIIIPINNTNPLILQWKLITNHIKLSSLNNQIFQINMIGEWNIYNITASIIMGTLKNIKIPNQLQLTKPSRRLEIIYNKNNKIIFDDYGVHPYEIQNVINNVKKIYNNIVIIWEPHRICRLKQFYNEFREIFYKEKFYFIDLYEVNHIKNNAFFQYINYGIYIKNSEELKNIITNSNNSVILLFNAGYLSDLVKNIIKNFNI